MLFLGVKEQLKASLAAHITTNKHTCSSTSYLIGGGSIAGCVRSQVGELLLQLVVRAVAEAVHHRGRQQHADDAEDGDDGEDQVLGGLCLAVLGGDLFDLVPLQKDRLTALTGFGPAERGPLQKRSV